MNKWQATDGMAMKPLVAGESCFPTEHFLLNDLVSYLRKSLLLCAGSEQTTCWGA